MKRIIILITILSLSALVSAEDVTEQKYSKTEFYNLKAGMTKVEVIEYLQLEKILKYLKSEYSYSYTDTTVSDLLDERTSRVYLEGIKHKDFLDKQFGNFSMEFTDDNILWKIQILFSLSTSDVLKEIALRNVIKKRFPEANIQEEEGVTGGQYSYPYHYLYVIMADQKIAESAIIKLENEYMQKM